jgi:hypothetical protein
MTEQYVIINELQPSCPLGELERTVRKLKTMDPEFCL